LRGVYLLLVRVRSDAWVRVGALGRLRFRRGFYVYVGSAQNNLEKRIMRHKRKQKPLKWHIDYLTSNRFSEVLEAAAFPLPKPYECAMARELESMGAEPVKRFGSSDCACSSHLYRLNKSFESVVKKLVERFGVEANIISFGARRR